MNENLKNEKAVREYLLGRISDENLLADYEELLFLDEDFCTLAEITEDDLINDFVFERLGELDRGDFIKTLENNFDRREKLAVTKAIKEKARMQQVAETENKTNFFESLKAFFQKPLYIGALVVLIAVVFSVWFVIFKNKNADELAELKTVYKNERPTETRISDFDYAPFAATRGEDEELEKSKMRRIENSLREKTEANPSAENWHALGVFSLTQRRFDEAIDALEKAVKADAKNAKYQNDLGAALLEFSGADNAKKTENLALANEAFSKAIELDPEFSEARFNKSLTLQKLDLLQQAKESWEIYLQKDSASKWADEARKNLEKLSSLQSLFKSNEQILEDFLTAYRNKDERFALKIHNETKGYLRDISIPLLLSRRLLEARRERNRASEKESIEAMEFIGGFEREKHADFFASEIAGFYRHAPPEKTEKLIEAKDIFDKAFGSIKDYGYAAAIGEFEKSRDLFSALGNDSESLTAEIWAASFLVYLSKIDDNRIRLNAIGETAKHKKFRAFSQTVLYSQSLADFRQNRFSDSLKNAKTALREAVETDNFFEIEHCVESIADTYSEIGETEKSLNLSGDLIRPDAYLKNKSQYWRNKGNLAGLMQKTNFLATAEDAAKEELWFAKKIMPDGEFIDSSLRRLAEISAEKKEFETALQTAEEARKNAETRDESEQNNFLFAESFLLLGDIKRRMGNCETALGDYEKSLGIYEKISELTVSIYSIHKGKLLCFSTLGKKPEFQNELEKVLDLSEEYRRKIREDESRQAFFENEQIVFDTAIENALANGETKRAFDYAETSRARSLLDFVRSEKSISETEKSFVEITKPLKLEDVQANLPENIQVLEYAVMEEKIGVWRITKDRFEYSEKAIDKEELEKKVNDYRFAILEKKDKNELKKMSSELFGILIPASVEQGKTICLIPDKILNLVPFVALISPNEKYLIEDFPIIYSASATVFVTATENAKKLNLTDETILSFGNPSFDRAENPSLKDLPDAETEARTIIGKYEKSLLFTGEKATRESFLNNFSGADIIHFAGHFVVKDHSPQNSKLIFADGNLYSHELADKKFSRTKMVALSACETWIEHYNRSEGAIGAVRTFLAMGTPLVLAGNWKIDSESTADLMIAFHENRKAKKMPSAESLRQAQIEILHRDDKNEPYFWAAFNLFGGLTRY